MGISSGFKGLIKISLQDLNPNGLVTLKLHLLSILPCKQRNMGRTHNGKAIFSVVYFNNTMVVITITTTNMTSAITPPRTTERNSTVSIVESFHSH